MAVKLRFEYILLLSAVFSFLTVLYSGHEKAIVSLNDLTKYPESLRSFSDGLDGTYPRPWKRAPSSRPHEGKKRVIDNNNSDSERNDINIVSDSSANVVVNVFYHTYAGPTEQHRELSRRIVREQIEYLGQASQATRLYYKWNLHYTSVGNATVLAPEWIQSLCREYSNSTLSCHHLAHLEDSHEEYTLTAMHNHCRQHPASTDHDHQQKQQQIVVYIHTKGAFLHSDMPVLQSTNEKWMPSLTKAPITSACLASLLPKGLISSNRTNLSALCNVCGLQFYPVWTMFFPGNMFAAHCSYIRRLLPVKLYAQKMQQIASELRPKRKKGPKLLPPNATWNFAGYENRDDHFGLDRFSNEHWIGSHPHLRPCDMTPEFHTGLFSQLPLDQVQLIFEQSETLMQPAPRVPLLQSKFYRWRKGKMLELIQQAEQNQHRRPHSYFLLPGILYRMYRLYGENNNQSDYSGHHNFDHEVDRPVEGTTEQDGTDRFFRLPTPQFLPPTDSWIWDYFPHGTVWREKVKNHPADALW